LNRKLSARCEMADFADFGIGVEELLNKLGKLDYELIML
jgi:hypothetical protein